MGENLLVGLVLEHEVSTGSDDLYISSLGVVPVDDTAIPSS